MAGPRRIGPGTWSIASVASSYRPTKMLPKSDNEISQKPNVFSTTEEGVIGRSGAATLQKGAHWLSKQEIYGTA